MGPLKCIPANGQTHPPAHKHKKREKARSHKQQEELPALIGNAFAYYDDAHTHTLPVGECGPCMQTHTNFLLYILVSSVPVQSEAGECAFYANERGVEGSQEMREHAGINLHFMITRNQSDL